jgi:glycosyltransferase involved in cell wall biosynthesis
VEHKLEMSKIPEVSVCIFSFNYELYIEQAIKSVLLQKADFGYEIVIGDDLSTDSTREIVMRLQKENPEIIRLSFNEVNIGGTKNWIKTINTCRGKYIALLDGDDYFTDAAKLQKQYDCLEADPKAVLCFHAVDEINDATKESSVVRFEQKKYTIEDFLTNGWFIRTSSTFFKKGILMKEPPLWVYNFPYRYDTILHIFLSINGHACYLNEVMSIWRKHSSGVSNQFAVDVIKNVTTEVAMAKELDKYSDFKYTKIVKKYCSKLYAGLLTHLLKKGLWAKNFNLTMSILFKSDPHVIFSSLKRKFKI